MKRHEASVRGWFQDLLGLQRIDFREAMFRYFAGDLDRIERRVFEDSLVHSRVLRRVFDAEYDARTRRHGLTALRPADPELSECFSVQTLEDYVAGRLDDDDRAMVEAHLSCPICGIQVQAIREFGTDAVRYTWRDRLDAFWGWLIGVAIRPTPVMAALAVVLLTVTLPRYIGVVPPGPHPGTEIAEYRDASGIFEDASVTLYAVTPDDRQIQINDVTTIPTDARLLAVADNASLDNPAYFAVYSLDDAGRPTWHLPAWDGPIPPSLLEVPLGAVEESYPQEVPALPPGDHTLYLVISPRLENLMTLREWVTSGSKPAGELGSTNSFQIQVR